MLFSCSFYAEGYSGAEYNCCRLNCLDVADFIPAARKWWGEHKARINAERIRQMALTVISITADRGECLHADLRAKGVSDDEIASLGALACAEAQRIVGPGPFTIGDGIAGNAASLDEEAARCAS